MITSAAVNVNEDNMRNTDVERRDHTRVEKAIGMGTNVQIGILGAIVGTVFLAGMWCSSINSKIDNLIKAVDQQQLLAQKIVDIDTRIKILESRK